MTPTDRPADRPAGRSVRSAPRREVERSGRAPGLLAGAGLVGAVFLVLPLAGLVLRTPWADLPRLLGSPVVGEALRLSLFCATAATGFSLLLGVPLAWLLARSGSRLVPLLRALVTLPLVLPPVVGGVALLLVLGRNGLVGRWLNEWWGVSLPFTPAAVVLAETFVAMPFLVVSVEGAFRGLDGRPEEAATTLGASPGRVFWSVTLPLAGPSILAGAVLAWARALGEFGATMTFAGSFPGRTETMPLAVYHALETDPPAATALSLVLLVACLLVLVLLRGRWVPTARSDR